MKKLILTLALMLPLMAPLPAGAVEVFGTCSGGAAANTVVCKATSSDALFNKERTGLLNRIINLLLFVGGLLAVLMVIIGGLRYVTSGGDPNSTTAAKNTVMYALIGLVIVLMSYAMVNFVITRLVK